MNAIGRLGAAVVLLAATFALLYRDVILKLVHDWANDDNYSHGFFVVPLALYFGWERRARVNQAGVHPSAWGLAILLGSIGVLAVGLLGAELFLTRISMLGVISGTIVFVLGWGALRTLTFPIAFLLLMIPIPALIFNEIAFPLQLLASRLGQAALDTLQIPVLREGNVIMLANVTLEVAEACSGIRSLISLLTIALVYAHFSHRLPAVRLTVTLATVPIAIVANAARVAGTGIAGHYYGPEAAQGFFHVFSGWVVSAFAFAMLLLVMRLLASLVPASAERPAVPAPVA